LSHQSDENLLAVLNEPSPIQKIALARNIVGACGSANFSFDVPENDKAREPQLDDESCTHSLADPRPCPFDLSAMPWRRSLLPLTPARPEHFEISAPDETPRRRSPKDSIGTAQLIHSLAQIELAAIEIDIAQLYLYPDAPMRWHWDMMLIIADECRHFEMLTGLLNNWKTPFGTWPVHHALWAGFLEGKTWLEHLALTTRFQEASGIDASHQLLSLASQAAADARHNTARLASLTELIRELHADEVRHVAAGSVWWNFAFDCTGIARSQRERDEQSCSAYFDLIGKRVRNPWSRRFPFYLEGRRLAGFSTAEIAQFEAIAESRQSLRQNTNKVESHV
jgi:uncharacterized ferritin-like protein (DUF455 family)